MLNDSVVAVVVAAVAVAAIIEVTAVGWWIRLLL